jgi:TRAP-type C4-dicarboxylate transport system permease small subunit
LRRVNNAVLALGRWLAAAALAIMVGFILAQVFYRDVLNAALPLPDEAARCAMLWMTGLIAPTAFPWRLRGHHMVPRALPAGLGRILSRVLLVLWKALKIGWSEVTGFAGPFKTASR